MALNPIAYTENVVRSFLRYQLTAYPFADPGPARPDARSAVARPHAPVAVGSKGRTSVCRVRSGKARRWRRWSTRACCTRICANGFPTRFTHLYSHQERAIRAIADGKATLVSTGTGSGKTECFLYPIVSKAFRLRDEDAPPGISAVIVYPMNALAEDQLMRLRGLLAGTGISFGIYTGRTPERQTQVTGHPLSPGTSRAEYENRLAEARRNRTGETIYPAEEVCSREVMRTPGQQPRILLTNVKQLELLLTRQQDIALFADARLDYLVFDEAHTFTGALGAETAVLIRRLRAFCNIDPRGARGACPSHGIVTRCVATSATIVDREDPDAARNFAARFFGWMRAR